MRGWGTAPNSSVNVTCISKQCLLLGQLDGSLLARDQDCEWEGELPNASNSHRSLHFGMACPHGPPSGGWLQMSYFLGHSVLAIIDMKLVAVK